MLTKILGQLLGAALILLVLSGSWIWFQSNRIKDLKTTSAELNRKIVALERAAVLTEKLHQDNAILTQEQNDLQKDLRDAQGYDTPLPDGIRLTLERMRQK